MNLESPTREFVLHFGEMGARWGMNRTVGQIYALLYLTEEPLCADELVEGLGLSRSNVSMGLKELKSWKLVTLVHRADDRRDFFQTPEDVWEIVRALAEQRKQREVDPTLTFLRELQINHGEALETYASRRIDRTAQIIETAVDGYEQLAGIAPERLEKLVAIGDAARKVLDFGQRKRRVAKTNQD